MAVLIHNVDGGRGEGEGKVGLVLEGCGGGRGETDDTACNSTEVGMEGIGRRGVEEEGLKGSFLENKDKGTGLKRFFWGDFIITWLGISGWLE